MNAKAESADDQPPVPEDKMKVAERVDRQQIQHFVAAIKSAEQQVGENIIAALTPPGTVAVLTTVIVGPDGQQRVVSAALNGSHLQQVQRLLQEAEEEREDDQPCVGFHCLIRPKSPG